MLTTDIPTTADRVDRAISARRWASGLSLIAFPALLVPQAIIDPAAGGTGAVMWEAAHDQRGALLTSAALLIVSGILMVPAVLGITRQARDRGAWLANVGAATAVLGGIGHVGIGLFYVMTAALPGGDRPEMEAYVDRLNGSTALALTAFPLITCFGIGMLLLPWAAFRAGVVARWAPVVATVAVLQHLVLPPEVPGLELITVLALLALTAVYSHLGTKVLALNDRAWAHR